MGPCRLLESREPRLCVSWRREKSEYYIDGLVVSSEATPHAARWLQTWMRRVFFACACACAPQTLNGTKAPEKPPKPPERLPVGPNRKPTQYILFFFFLAVFFAAEEVTSRMAWQCNWLHFSFVGPPCVLLCHGFARRWQKINDHGVFPSESLFIYRRS